MIPFAISFVVWAAVHSITAAKSTKAAVRAQIGERAYEGWYRLSYNAISAVTFVPVLYFLWTGLPQTVVWQWTGAWRVVSAVGQIAALLGLAYALWVTDIWSFIGLRQAWRYVKGEPEPTVEMTLIQSGPYAWVRHPLYTFSLLFLGLNPTMTIASLVFWVATLAYFWVGSLFEERRLVREFGDAYEGYRQRVGRLLPRPRQLLRPSH